MTSREERERGRETTPSKFGETTPQTYPGTDYSFTLQAVMEMQKAIGKLTQAVETLTEKTNKHEEKIDKISHRVYAAAAIVSVFAVVAGFILNKLADAVISALKIAK
jgi:hypothetical protein